MPVVDPRDPQQHAVYDWERACVEPLVPSEVMGVPEVTAAVLSACGWLGIPTATVTPRRGMALPCQAIPSRWTILVADWGRNATTVLHEVAHLGTVGEVRAGEAPHGPAFLGTAIALYAHFMGIPVDDMVASATRRKLSFRIPSRLRITTAPPPGKSDFFAGDW